MFKDVKSVKLPCKLLKKKLLVLERENYTFD